MPPTDANFQDLVVLSQDTLSFKGAQLAIGTTTASTVSYVMSNSAASVALAAAPTANITVWMPTTNGTLGLVTGVAAGTQTASTGAVVFSNSNNVTFGMSASSIVTASASFNQTGVQAIAAGTQTVTSGTVVFSNSNNVSFGMSGSSVVTATASASQSISPGAIAAGTQTATSGTVVFSNSNNVTFGMSASSVVTASAAANSAINVSAGTTSSNLISLVFSNSNNITFGLNGGTLTATVAPGLAIADSANTASTGTVIFSNSNGISFGMALSSIITAQLGGVSSWSNGWPASSYGGTASSLSLQPGIVDYCFTATNLLLLAAMSGLTGSSGGLTFSAAVYTINGGTTGSLSLASSQSTTLSWTSGGAYSSQSGTQYYQMSLGSWAFTPGPYVFAFGYTTANSASLTFYSPMSAVSIATVVRSALTNQVFPGYMATNGLPNSLGITNTSTYVRTGQSALRQPWLVLQGT